MLFREHGKGPAREGGRPRVHVGRGARVHDVYPRQTDHKQTDHDIFPRDDDAHDICLQKGNAPGPEPGCKQDSDRACGSMTAPFSSLDAMRRTLALIEHGEQERDSDEEGGPDIPEEPPPWYAHDDIPTACYQRDLRRRLDGEVLSRRFWSAVMSTPMPQRHQVSTRWVNDTATTGLVGNRSPIWEVANAATDNELPNVLRFLERSTRSVNPEGVALVVSAPFSDSAAQLGLGEERILSEPLVPVEELIAEKLRELGVPEFELKVVNDDLVGSNRPIQAIPPTDADEEMKGIRQEFDRITRTLHTMAAHPIGPLVVGLTISNSGAGEPKLVQAVGRVRDKDGVLQGAKGYANPHIYVGDHILSIDRRKAQQMTMHEMHRLLNSGEPNSLVEISLRRPHDGPPCVKYSVTLMRQVSHSDTSKSDAIPRSPPVSQRQKRSSKDTTAPSRQDTRSGQHDAWSGDLAVLASHNEAVERAEALVMNAETLPAKPLAQMLDGRSIRQNTSNTNVAWVEHPPLEPPLVSVRDQDSSDDTPCKLCLGVVSAPQCHKHNGTRTPWRRVSRRLHLKRQGLELCLDDSRPSSAPLLKCKRGTAPPAASHTVAAVWGQRVGMPSCWPNVAMETRSLRNAAMTSAGGARHPGFSFPSVCDMIYLTYMYELMDGWMDGCQEIPRVLRVHTQTYTRAGTRRHARAYIHTLAYTHMRAHTDSQHRRDTHRLATAFLAEKLSSLRSIESRP